jgi:hypothetical protein
MYHFEIGFINYIKEMQRERDAKAVQQAEREAQEGRQKYMRNENETKSQAEGKRGGTSRD